MSSVVNLYRGPVSPPIKASGKDELLHPLSLADIGYTEAQVSIVTTKESLDKAVEKILASKRVGIDIETVPTILKFQECSPSLLQLAVQDEIFVIDLLVEEEEGFGAYAFDQFAKLICSNVDLLKVGQGLDNDVKVLKKKYQVADKIVG